MVITKPEIRDWMNKQTDNYCRQYCNTLCCKPSVNSPSLGPKSQDFFSEHMLTFDTTQNGLYYFDDDMVRIPDHKKMARNSPFSSTIILDKSGTEIKHPSIVIDKNGVAFYYDVGNSLCNFYESTQGCRLYGKSERPDDCKKYPLGFDDDIIVLMDSCELVNQEEFRKELDRLVSDSFQVKTTIDRQVELLEKMFAKLE